MTWEFNGDLPIYKQVAGKLRMRIVSGGYPPGSRVPAVRELAMEAGVNPNTMQRALAELEREGLVIAQRTSGRFVTDEPDALQALRVSMAKEYIEEMYEQLRKLGFRHGEIAEAVKSWMSAEKDEED